MSKLSFTIQGLHEQKLSSFVDSRGTFTRIFDTEWMPQLEEGPKQINLSSNPKLGTLRGLHFQTDEENEHKRISLLSGSIFLAVIDLRKKSDTYKVINSLNLSFSDNLSIFVPAGCATGWITLEPNTNLHYIMHSRFEENTYSGLRFDDASFTIDWPLEPTCISSQDLAWPKFSD